MKEIQIGKTNFTIGPMTLAQVIALQAATAVIQRLAASPQDVRTLTAAETHALAAALAAILGVKVETVLDWPLAQTLSAAVIAGQAWMEVNGPYLARDVVPALERLTAFANGLTAALAPKAA